MLILFAILIFNFGILIGLLLKSWLAKEKAYSGTIIVSKDEGKLIYSLELNDNPEKLQYNDEVLFKIDSSGVDLSRE